MDRQRVKLVLTLSDTLFDLGMSQPDVPDTIVKLLGILDEYKNKEEDPQPVCLNTDGTPHYEPDYQALVQRMVDAWGNGNIEERIIDEMRRAVAGG